MFVLGIDILLGYLIMGIIVACIVCYLEFRE